MATGGLTVGLCTGPGFECSFSQRYRNEGAGCGNSLHGKVRLYLGDTLLETEEWWLDSTVLVRPGESITVEDCCLAPDAVRDATRSTAEAFWNNISCS